MTIMMRLRDLEDYSHTHEDDEHFTVVKEGDHTIKHVPRDTSVAAGLAGGSYTGMFKVSAGETASDETPSIHVKDGRDGDSTTCGIAIVSGEMLECDIKEIDFPALLQDGTTAYLVVYYYVSDPEGTPEIKIGKDLASEAAPFEMLSLADFLAALPNAHCGRSLIARVSAKQADEDSAFVITVTQEHTGAVYGVIHGPCPEE